MSQLNLYAYQNNNTIPVQNYIYVAGICWICIHIYCIMFPNVWDISTHGGCYNNYIASYIYIIRLTMSWWSASMVYSTVY